MLGYGYYYDPTYILVLIGALLSLWASAKVKSTYSRYAKVYSRSGLTGAEAAQQILKNAGIYGHILTRRMTKLRFQDRQN